MKRGLILGAVVVKGALLAAVGAAQQTPSATSIQVDKIRDNRYILRGGGGNTAAFIDVVSSWKVPERFQKEGYLTPEEIQQLLRWSPAVQTARLRSTVEIIWNETK
jgi:hypothetical protein